MARLAVAKMGGVDWGDLEAVGRLRIADFACGTGALLSAVYEQIAARHERAGGDPEALHKVMMEEVLYGCDVMPSAVHITASTLAGVEPSVDFENSRIHSLTYGRQPGGGVKIGSLELLKAQAVELPFNTSNPAMRTGRSGEETSAYTIGEFPHKHYDLIIMNPPFTNATNHEGAHADITNPAFAAFGATPADQKEMGKRANRLAAKTCSHGNAGISSTFAALGHKKLKPGGILALVLPLSVANGLAWEKFRDMIRLNYTDVMILSIAANGRDMAFSSDTGMGDCLIVARRLRRGESPDVLNHFVSLGHRPKGFAYARQLAGTLLEGESVRGLDDGPYGGTRLPIGEELVGESITASPNTHRSTWGAVRLSDYSLAQAAYALSHSKLWLPGELASKELKIALLGEVAELGFVHRDITGPIPRGPFDKVAASPTATYPSLWNHNAKNETRMLCKPDSQLQVRQGMEEKAARVWATASRGHLNLEFTFGSQALAIALTSRETVGGTVWPNVIFPDARFDMAFSVWGNSTLGLLAYWWHSNRQQSSKARMTIRSAESLPVLDFRALSDEQLVMAELIFDEFRGKELKPAYLADADPNRALLDRRVICDLLGFDKEVYVGVRRLAAKWCAEPSVHGGKERPRGSTLVM